VLNADIDVQVDMYERLPVPFGLVRYGVAPDHQKLKGVTAVFDGIAAHPNFQFFGNVTIGQDVEIKELEAAYDAIIIASGAISDRKLGIAGEDLDGSASATEFVSWYNGHPEFRGHSFDLSHPCAVVIGNGNVALDVSRILAKTPEELASSDICEHALKALSSSKITDIVIVGRRGPLQASFSIRELREFSTLSDAEPVFDPAELEAADTSPEELQTAARMLGILKSFAHPDAPRQTTKRIHFRFLLSPHEIAGNERVEGITFARCALEGEAFKRRPVPTGNHEVVPAGLVLRSVGYRGRALPGVPFDDAAGIIPSQLGRVTDTAGQPVPKLYTAGWIRRGPSGIIGTNRECANDTVDAVVADLKTTSATSDPVERMRLHSKLAAAKPAQIDFSGWQRIDGIERKAGEACGKPREKITSVSEMLTAAGVP
jgi:ferredoxin--NADP+ reductase